MMNRLGNIPEILLVFFLVGVLASCKPPASPVDQESSSVNNIVAKVGNRSITHEALLREMAKVNGRVPPEKVLEDLIRREALLYRAKVEGIGDDPEVQARFQALLIGELKKRFLEPELRKIEISEEEIQQAYHERSELFREPEQRRLAIIHALDHEGQAHERVALAAQQSENLPAEQAFAQFALDHSDDKRSRYRGGDIGWVRRDLYPSSTPQPLIEEGFTLAAVGEISEPIRLKDGWGLVRLVQVRPGHVRLMDTSVKKEIRSLLLKEKREKLIKDFESDAIALSTPEIIQTDWLDGAERNDGAKEIPKAPPLP